MPFPLLETYIAETELKLGARFPDSYRQKMMSENGGELETENDDWTLNPILDKSDKKRMMRTCNDVVRETQQAKQWPGFPPNGVSIAQNGSGDHMVFLIKGDTMGPEVCLWSHEEAQLEEISPDFAALV
jgi:hypothetical protein